jgi:hypothetical protein
MQAEARATRNQQLSSEFLESYLPSGHQQLSNKSREAVERNVVPGLAALH